MLFSFALPSLPLSLSLLSVPLSPSLSLLSSLAKVIVEESDSPLRSPDQRDMGSERDETRREREDEGRGME